MDYAIRLAARNVGNTGENPSVGCVITSNNKIISIGVTGKNGTPHAEHNAIHGIKNFPINTTVYVTLEPCSHSGKNPPCTNLLIKKKLTYPALDYVLKCSHIFNLLDARGVISVTDRAQYIEKIRKLAREVASSWIEERNSLKFPLLKK